MAGPLFQDGQRTSNEEKQTTAVNAKEPNNDDVALLRRIPEGPIAHFGSPEFVLKDEENDSDKWKWGEDEVKKAIWSVHQLEREGTTKLKGLIDKARKTLWYSLMLSHDHEDGPTSSSASLPPGLAPTLQKLFQRTADYFTPVLFTAPGTPHIECTDAFAGAWMEHVIGPAISPPVHMGDFEGNAETRGRQTTYFTPNVYSPLESLAALCEMSEKWRGLGVCEGCVREKKEEWEEEANAFREVWGRWVAELDVSFVVHTTGFQSRTNTSKNPP